MGTGTEWEGDERVKGSTAETARKRPERPWIAARTMEVLRRCPLAIAQRLVRHCAIALSTAVLDRVTKTMSVAQLLTNNLDNSKQKTSNLLSPAPVSYTHLRAHETRNNLVCRLLLRVVQVVRQQLCNGHCLVTLSFTVMKHENGSHRCPS